MRRSSRNKVDREIYARRVEAESERYVSLARYRAGYMADNSSRATRHRAFEQRRSKGQALLLIALVMTVLILFVGLGVDVGNLMGKRAKLQSAVDSSALSAAQLLS